MFGLLKNHTHKLLRRSEKYAKTDMVYLAKGGSWLVLGQGIAMLAGFFISIAFANLFPKESFGTYKFVLSVTAILAVFSLSELGTAVTRAVACGFGGSLRYSFQTNLRWSLGVFLGGFGLAVYYFINNDYVLALSFILAGVFLPVTTSGALYSSYLLGKKDFRRITYYGTVRNVISAIFLILTLILTRNLVIVITVYFLSGTLLSLLFFHLTTRVYPSENEKIDPELARYGGHLSIMEVLATIAAFFDKILIFHYLGATPLAIYAFAIAPIEQLQGGKKILTSLIQPKLNERPFEELQKTAPRKVLLLTIYAIVLAGIYATLAPYFYKFLYPQYLHSVIYSQIYSLTLLAVGGSVLSEMLVAHKKTKELYLQRIIVPVVQIILFLILLPKFGLMGLIVTHVIMRSFSGLLAYYFVKNPLKK